MVDATWIGTPHVFRTCIPLFCRVCPAMAKQSRPILEASRNSRDFARRHALAGIVLMAQACKSTLMYSFAHAENSRA